jgi:hypothetical protein
VGPILPVRDFRYSRASGAWLSQDGTVQASAPQSALGSLSSMGPLLLFKTSHPLTANRYPQEQNWRLPDGTFNEHGPPASYRIVPTPYSRWQEWLPSYLLRLHVTRRGLSAGHNIGI